MTEFLKTQRYPSSGLAHSAADEVAAATGKEWKVYHRPRWRLDPTPFVITEARKQMEPA